MQKKLNMAVATGREGQTDTQRGRERERERWLMRERKTWRAVTRGGGGPAHLGGVAVLILQGNCITYRSAFPAPNGRRGWKCRWQLGTGWESNKESLRHKTQVRHPRTFSWTSVHSTRRLDTEPMWWCVRVCVCVCVCVFWLSVCKRRLKARLGQHRGPATANKNIYLHYTHPLANKQRTQTIILHYIHDYSTLHFLTI